MFEGHDVAEGVRNTNVASPDQCREDCRINEKCKFWTFASKTCYLKSEKALENRTKQDNAVSGTKQCPGTRHILYSVFFSQLVWFCLFYLSLLMNTKTDKHV